jgi:hypothetical protein
VASRYATVQDVADHLGAALTGLQSAEADRLLAAAESWIDGRTGRTWGATDPTTEAYTVLSQGLYLRRAPVASVSAVSVRSATAGAGWDALPAASFELLDPAQGLLALPWGYAGWLARVTYTPAQTVDPRVRAAAAQLAAHWLRPTVDGEASGSAGGGGGVVKSYSLGQELTVTYDSAATVAATTAGSTLLAGIPDEVLTLLAGLREPVLA